MLSFAHTLISLPFAVYFENPLIIFAAAFIWHLACDTLLHWNIYATEFKRYPWHLIVADVVGGVVAAWFILDDTFLTLPFLAAVAGGNAPDVLHGIWDLLTPTQRTRYLNWAKPWFVFHEHLQLETTHIGAGLISQVVLVVAALFLLY